MYISLCVVIYFTIFSLTLTNTPIIERPCENLKKKFKQRTTIWLTAKTAINHSKVIPSKSDRI